MKFNVLLDGMSLDHDQYYIDRAIEGDISAFSVLVDRYKQMVFTLAFRMVKKKEEAEEVSQDTFLKIHQNLAKFKGDSKFSTWVYRIAFNRSLDYIKSSDRKPKTELLENYSRHNPIAAPDILEGLEIEDRKKIVRNAIDELSGEEATLITLFYYEELTLKEIAEVTSMEANTAKVKLYRSRKKLAQIFTNKLEPETLRKYGKK